MSSVNTEKTRRMVGLSILTALVIVLQFVAEYIKVGATPITLTLVPIVVGSALYGVRGGAWLGGVFGVVVWLMSIANIDPTGALLWNLNPFLTTVICIGKGALAGLAAAGTSEELMDKYLETMELSAEEIYGALGTGIVSPIVNTGLFIVGVYVFFNDTLVSWTNGTAMLPFIIFTLVGFNFLVELTLNIVLSSVIERIINYRVRALA